MHVNDPLPMWASVLVAAENWGKSPWEISGEEPDLAVRLKWFRRWLAYYNKKQEQELEAAKG